METTSVVSADTSICNETSAAEIFASDNGAHLRYVPDFGWVYWTGRVWKLDKPGNVWRMCRPVAAYYADQADALEFAGGSKSCIKQFRTFERHCKTKRGIEAIMTLARPLLYAPLDDFDSTPLMLNVGNCVLDFSSVANDNQLPQHRDHATSFFQTKMTACDWCMESPSMLWHQVLQHTFPDPELRAFFHRAIGYSVLGRPVEKCFFLCTGPKDTGKSLVLNVLHDVLGDYAMTASCDTFMAQTKDGKPRNDLADLRGLRFVIALETGNKARFDENLLKSITGGEHIRARHLYHESFQFRSRFVLWIASNFRPSADGADDAFWRRMIAIPFTNPVPREEQDPLLHDKLMRQAEGILHWIVEGASAYLRLGLRPPNSVLAEVKSYQTDQDTIGTFIEENTINGKDSITSKAALYRAYTVYCEGIGEYAVSSKRFGSTLIGKGYKSGNTGTMRFWKGIKLTHLTD